MRTWLLSDPGVGHCLEDLDRGGTTVRQIVGGGLADLLSRDGAAQRGAGGIHVDGGAAFLAGREQEGDLVLVTGEPDRHGHARPDHALSPWRLADPGVLQDVLDLPDARLLLALLLLGRVVAAVLPQVALVSGGLDLLRDLHTRGAGQIVELRLESVMRLLGEPGDILARLGHGYSLPACERMRSAGASRAPWGY